MNIDLYKQVMAIQLKMKDMASNLEFIYKQGYKDSGALILLKLTNHNSENSVCVSAVNYHKFLTSELEALQISLFKAELKIKESINHKVCSGLNCDSINGTKHSDECLEEHDKAY